MNSYRILLQSMPDEPKLTSDQENALRSLPELARYGFTTQQMRSWNSIFYDEHEKALRYLCQSGSSPQEAIEIVSGLSVEKAAGIAKGLTRDEMFGLNHSQIESLAQLRKEGLTAELLRSWQGKQEFSPSHQAALIELIQQRQKTPQAAIAEINQLGESQAEGIAKGLTREEVLGFNRDQIKTLVILKGKLSASQLRAWQGEEFDNYHTKALKLLIVQRSMSAENAIAEINELNSGEANGIAKGLPRDEVKGLQDCQIEALLKLRQKNPHTELKPEHLRNWQGNFFSYSHKDALVDLIDQRHFKPQDAIAEINNLSEFEAETIAGQKLRRDEVFGFNGWEVEILQKLKSHGLLPVHLRSRIRPDHGDEIATLFLSGHAKALTYLIKQCSMKPKDAIKEIGGLDNNQAHRIAKGETREQILGRTLSFKS